MTLAYSLSYFRAQRLGATFGVFCVAAITLAVVGDRVLFVPEVASGSSYWVSSGGVAMRIAAGVATAAVIPVPTYAADLSPRSLVAWRLGHYATLAAMGVAVVSVAASVGHGEAAASMVRDLGFFLGFGVVVSVVAHRTLGSLLPFAHLLAVAFVGTGPVNAVGEVVPWAWVMPHHSLPDTGATILAAVGFAAGAVALVGAPRLPWNGFRATHW